MMAKIRLLTITMAVGSTLAFEAVYAADASDLAAPVYPGAVPAIPADGAQVDPFYVGTFGGIKALDCAARRDSTDIAGRGITAQEAEAAGDRPGPWCFLTRDPIDQVKAFYEQSIEPMRPMQAENGGRGFVAFAERAWYPSDGEARSAGFGYSTVSVHALPPPPERGATAGAAAMLRASVGLTEEAYQGQDAQTLYAASRHFNGFIDAIDWFGDPSKRPQSDLDALYKQYSYLETALFQRKAPSFEQVDVVLGRQYAELRKQRQEAATMAQSSGLMQLGAAMANNDAGPTAQEDAQFNRVMQENPELAQRYVALTQQVSTLMMQGRMNEADPLLDEIEELENSHPELKALNAQQQARSDRVGAAHQTQQDAILAAGSKQMDDAIWGTAMEYIQAIDKEDYYTLIVIDSVLRGYERDYSRDRAVLAADTAPRYEFADLRGWDFQYRQDETGAAVVPTSAEQPAAEEPEQNLEDKARQGLRRLRGMF